MTRLAAFTLLALSFLNGAFASAQKKTEEPAIRAAVADYIEGYYNHDVARMERSLHPHYLKHTISESEGKLRMTETTGLQLLEEARSAGPVPTSERREEISILDVASDVASAKLVTTHWTDYLTLSKWNGQWKIVSVVLRESD